MCENFRDKDQNDLLNEIMQGPKIRIAAFLAEIGSTAYRAVLLKHTGNDISIWSWLDMEGTVVSITARGQQTVTGVEGGHITYHGSGRTHRRVEQRKGSKTLYQGEGSAFSDIKNCQALTLLPVPLDGPIPGNPQKGPWGEAEQIVLRAKDFDNARGVNLAIFLARKPAIAELTRRWKESWVFESEPFSAVIGAEPIR